MSSYTNLFTPYTIKGTTFKNRIFASPVTVEGLNNGNAFSETAIVEYGNRARGGFAQVTVTEHYVNFDFAGRGINPIDLVTPAAMENQDVTRRLTQSIKAHGAVASIQFNHVGNVNHPSTCGGRNPIGPSAFVRDDGVVIDEMDEEMMLKAADDFANAAKNARQFGFDMVMIHGGHGWLLSQFVSPLSNRRNDKWGGSLENRARFPMLVLERMRQAVGDDFLIEYRISGDERTKGGLTIEESSEFCKIIETKADIIHVTAGMYHNHIESKSFSSMFEPHGCNVELAAAIKQAVNIPVVSVGGFNDPALMEKVISEGFCDFVAVGRQQIADPYLPLKAMSGAADEISPCLRCSCFNPMPSNPDERILGGKRGVTCTVNPRSYRTLELALAPKPIVKKCVLVIGGGASGLYAAFTAAEQGHDVTLYEKSERLGGHLWFTDHDPHKEDLRKYRDSLITKVYRRGVKVELGVAVTKDYIKSNNPDCVICCIGSEPIVPSIPGIGNAEHALYAYSDYEKLGDRIVIIGGGLVGCEEALYLAEAGKDVILVEMLDSLAKDAYSSHRTALMNKIEGLVKAYTSAVCSKITPDGVWVNLNDGSSEGADERVFIEADNVLYAVGMKARKNEVEELRGDFAYFVEAGDCKRARTVEEAVYDGFNAAMDIL